jgi:methionyl aminopeptidase
MKKTKILNIGEWKSEPLSLDLEKFPPNLFLNYDKTLNPMKPPDETPMKLYDINKMRKSAEAHRQVRRYIQSIIKPDMKIFDICSLLENKTRELLGDNLMAGIGFPTGFSLNDCAAHDSAIPKDNRVLKETDICKLDFGTHVEGYITDSAFTIAFDERFKPLIDATRDGTWAGIKMAGPDVLINDVSKEIKEAIESYEMEWEGKIYPIKAITNLGGHNILKYQIHGGDLILGGPSVYTEGRRMRANTIYAIETFGSTGSGEIHNDYDMECSHYSRPPDAPKVPLKFNSSKQLLGHIISTRSTLPFCTRWLDKDFGVRFRMGLSELSKNNIVHSYPPLCDIKGSFTSQLEHTIYLHEFGKEILSYGDDY